MDPSESLPWYRYFWPWFIVILLGSSVLASLAIVLLAFSMPDPLVRDDWYQEGTAINRRLELEREAQRLGVEATLQIDELTGELSIELRGNAVESVRTLRLELSHPTRAERDQILTLPRTPLGDYRVFLAQPLRGRWYATLSSKPEGSEGAGGGSWRLSQLVTLPAPDGLRLGAER